MADSDEIATALMNQGLTLVGDVIEDKEGRGHLAFLEISFDNNGRQAPNNYAISKAEKHVESQFGNISFIIVNSGINDIQTTVKSMIMRKFFNFIRNTFTSVEGKNISLWIEPKTKITDEQSDEIKYESKKLINFFGYSLDHFTNTLDINVPSNTACLNIIRQKSPLSQDELEIELRQKGFDFPTKEWLARSLDRWRKTQLIHRKTDGNYTMTVRGLKALGSGKDRRSPDIIRALDIARRRD